jgi:hypothetical protein
MIIPYLSSVEDAEKVEKPTDDEADEALELGETEDDYSMTAPEPDEMDISEDNTDSDPKYDSTEENPSDASVSDAEFNFEIKPIKPGSRRVGVRRKRVQIRYSKPVETAACDICQKQFTGRFASQILKRHLKIHARSSNNKSGRKKKSITGPFICPICQKEFKESSWAASTLRKHVKGHDVAKRPYTPRPFKEPKPKPVIIVSCHICDKQFQGDGAKASLSKHIRIHNGERERKFPCPHCPFRFMNNKNRQLHIQRVHLKLKPYPCKFCGRKFTTNMEKDNHEKVFLIYIEYSLFYYHHRNRIHSPIIKLLGCLFLICD